jgi:hypothetical protein
VAVGDLNGDGKLDLAVADFTDGFVSVLLGNGDGTFQPSVEYPTGKVPSTIIIGDFNGDGKSDIVTSNFSPAGYTVPPGYINVLLGNGDGTFQAPVAFIAGPNPDTVVVADLNNDGALDFITGSGSVPGAATFSVLPQVPQGNLPQVGLSSGILTFPSQWVGTTSAAQNLILTNTGNAPLIILSIAINDGDFAQTNDCGTSVAAGANCTITVTFTPTAAGARSGMVAINDNAPKSQQTVSLAGVGTTPLLSVSPSSLTFSNQYVGTSGLPQTVTLTNNGTAVLTITKVAASPSDFGLLNACGNTVAVGGSCSIGIFFDPTAVGTRSGTLTVTDNATGSPQTVALSGEGQDFSMVPSSPSTASVSAGQIANYMVTISPGGGFNQMVALSCNGAPQFSACSVVPGSVVLNGSTPASVAIAVTTAATSASLSKPLGFPPARQGPTFALAASVFPGAVLLSVLFGLFRRQQRGLLSGLVVVCLLSIAITLCSCGGGSGGNRGGGGTPAGTYNLTVTGTFSSGSTTTLTHSAKLTLVVN